MLSILRGRGVLKARTATMMVLCLLWALQTFLTTFQSFDISGKLPTYDHSTWTVVRFRGQRGFDDLIFGVRKFVLCYRGAACADTHLSHTAFTHLNTIGPAAGDAPADKRRAMVFSTPPCFPLTVSYIAVCLNDRSHKLVSRRLKKSRGGYPPPPYLAFLSCRRGSLVIYANADSDFWTLP